MKKKSLFYAILCMGLLCACDKDEEVIPPVVETPDEPDEPEVEPSVEHITRIQVEGQTLIIGGDEWKGMAYGNGKYVAVGDSNRVACSTDGETWEFASTYASKIDWTAVMYDEVNKYFIGCGANNRICYTDEENLDKWAILNTNSGSNWSDILFYPHDKHVALVLSQNKYAALYLSSWPDEEEPAVIWETPVPYGGGYVPEFGNTLKGKKIAKGLTDTELVHISDRSVKWGNLSEVYHEMYFSDREDVYLNDVACGNEKYVAVGKAGKIFVIGKAPEYEVTEQTVGEKDWNAVLFKEGRFIALGNEGTVATSVDGEQWNVQKVSDYNLYAAV